MVHWGLGSGCFSVKAHLGYCVRKHCIHPDYLQLEQTAATLSLATVFLTLLSYLLQPFPRHHLISPQTSSSYCIILLLFSYFQLKSRHGQARKPDTYLCFTEMILFCWCTEQALTILVPIEERFSQHELTRVFCYLHLSYF